MFVGLIDTRHRWDPEPEPEPERQRRRLPPVPWRAVAWVAVILALFGAADATSGLLAYGLVMLGLTAACLGVDRLADGYWLGLSEHRQ